MLSYDEASGGMNEHPLTHTSSSCASATRRHGAFAPHSHRGGYGIGSAARTLHCSRCLGGSRHHRGIGCIDPGTLWRHGGDESKDVDSSVSHRGGGETRPNQSEGREGEGAGAGNGTGENIPSRSSRAAFSSCRDASWVCSCLASEVSFAHVCASDCEHKGGGVARERDEGVISIGLTSWLHTRRAAFVTRA